MIVMHAENKISTPLLNIIRNLSVKTRKNNPILLYNLLYLKIKPNVLIYYQSLTLSQVVYKRIRI